MAAPDPPERVPPDAPLGAIMHAVLEYLRSVLRPVPSSELASALGVDVDRRPELAAELEANPKCLREVNGEWRWRSKHYLRSAAELASLLRRCPNGIVSEELWDAYAGIKDDIEDPPTVIAIKNSATRRVVLYPISGVPYPTISPDVKERWSAIRLPDAVDIHRYLVERGLKANTSAGAPRVVAAFSRRRPTRKGRAGGTKRLKLTNVHLEGSAIDLNADLAGGKGAFS
ncbi:hypothetical protein MMPV_008917 [Pyropia vietnamensis]